MTNLDQAEILLIEDSPTDRLLARRALAQAGIRSHLSFVEDGVEALAFLRREGSYAQAPRPQLVLLDLNMPRKSGREVLAEIKTDPALSAIPVVVLTTSESQDDVAQVYALHANCLIQKPIDYRQFSGLIQKVIEFWLLTAKLPSKV